LFASTVGESAAQAALGADVCYFSTKAALLAGHGSTLSESVVAPHVLALTQEILKTMFVTKLKLPTAAVLCAGLFVLLFGGSFSSFQFRSGCEAEVTCVGRKSRASRQRLRARRGFIRRIRKEFARAPDPTLTEIHFFVTS